MSSLSSASSCVTGTCSGGALATTPGACTRDAGTAHRTPTKPRVRYTDYRILIKSPCPLSGVQAPYASTPTPATHMSPHRTY